MLLKTNKQTKTLRFFYKSRKYQGLKRKNFLLVLDLFVRWIIYRHTSNFRAIWRLSPLPVTGLRFSAVRVLLRTTPEGCSAEWALTIVRVRSLLNGSVRYSLKAARANNRERSPCWTGLCCDTGPPCFRSYSKDPWFSHLNVAPFLF
jgi:hypothetical protein